MIIYLDELLIQNFIMTYLILIITEEILAPKYRKRDLMIGSMLSSLITLISIIFDIENNIIMKSITLFVILKVSFKTKNIKDIIFESTCVLAITFLIGGIIKSSITNYYEIIACGVISIVTIKNYNDYYKKKKWKIRNQYKLTFKVENRKIELKAFLDTGNFLSTNITKEPVIVVSKNAIKYQISKELLDLLENGNKECLTFNILKNIRLINYSVLNAEMQVMYGLKIKDITIETEKNIICRDAVIALSKNEIYESDAIIGINLLEGGICNGNSSYVETESKKVIC